MEETEIPATRGEGLEDGATLGSGPGQQSCSFSLLLSEDPSTLPDGVGEGLALVSGSFEGVGVGVGDSSG